MSIRGLKSAHGTNPASASMAGMKVRWNIARCFRFSFCISEHTKTNHMSLCCKVVVVDNDDEGS
jgi:hypothetical protein